MGQVGNTDIVAAAGAVRREHGKVRRAAFVAGLYLIPSKSVTDAFEAPEAVARRKSVALKSHLATSAERHRWQAAFADGVAPLAGAEGSDWKDDSDGVAAVLAMLACFIGCCVFLFPGLCLLSSGAHDPVLRGTVYGLAAVWVLRSMAGMTAIYIASMASRRAAAVVELEVLKLWDAFVIREASARNGEVGK